jgi:hypothetical protein
VPKNVRDMFFAIFFFFIYMCHNITFFVEYLCVLYINTLLFICMYTRLMSTQMLYTWAFMCR